MTCGASARSSGPRWATRWKSTCGTSRKVSKSRIKRLRESTHRQYRLRVDDLRVFHDIEGEMVQILAIVGKSDAADWLRELGGGDEDSPAVGSEG